jgi:hypothetical protein
MCAMRIDPAAVLDAASAPNTEAPQSLLGEIALFWRQFVVAAFNPYHPEKHYMRGPGPAWRAKHLSGHRGDNPRA